MSLQALKRKIHPIHVRKHAIREKQVNSRNEAELKRKIGLDKLSLPRDIPDDLDEFYKGFDPIINTDTLQEVPYLADHQREIWNHRTQYIYRAYPKSQKIFLSTTFIFEDIWHALTDAMGMEILIIAQSEHHAKLHLSDFKKYVQTSRYRDYLIRKAIPEIGLERNEITKSTVAYMHNPDKPFFPTKIYAVGPSAGSLISYKKIKHIHASDITRSKETPESQKEAFASMVSRLAISKGSMVYEAPFRGMTGPLYEQFEKFNEITEKGIDLSVLSRTEQRKMPFFFKQYDYTYGIASGAFDEAFIEGERLRHGPLFDMYYGAKPVQSDISWITPDMFSTSEEANKFFQGLG
jgi:hypothetical protein